eukprot:scaffold106655_cov69-Phaeocystis_antarctica.AAC.1
MQSGARFARSPVAIWHRRSAQSARIAAGLYSLAFGWYFDHSWPSPAISVSKYEPDDLEC